MGGVDGRATVGLGLYRSSYCMVQGVGFSCLIYCTVPVVCAFINLITVECYLKMIQQLRWTGACVYWRQWMGIRLGWTKKTESRIGDYLVIFLILGYARRRLMGILVQRLNVLCPAEREIGAVRWGSPDSRLGVRASLRVDSTTIWGC